ncbi:hypothetical protein K501DRAFT_268891 [Backusella circina FSU 941]|nr:hypothetical protein K501DRAFT_268891 [Backusella circina FSU 941]
MPNNGIGFTPIKSHIVLEVIDNELPTWTNIFRRDWRGVKGSRDSARRKLMEVKEESAGVSDEIYREKVVQKGSEGNDEGVGRGIKGSRTASQRYIDNVPVKDITVRMILAAEQASVTLIGSHIAANRHTNRYINHSNIKSSGKSSLDLSFSTEEYGKHTELSGSVRSFLKNTNIYRVFKLEGISNTGTKVMMK